MKTSASVPVSLLLLAQICAAPFHLRAQDQPQDERVKAVAKIYGEIEKALPDTTNLQWKAQNFEEEFTHTITVWVDREGRPVKMIDILERLTQVEETHIFLQEGRPFFVLRRQQEDDEGDGTGKVTEHRLYFDKGKLFRHLTKEANFATGEKRDTAKTKNVEVPVKLPPGEDGGFARYQKMAMQVTDKLLKGPAVEEEEEVPEPPSSDASAPPAKSDSTPPPKPKIVAGDATALPSGPASWHCRAVDGTKSPDGRFAIAWGFAGEAKADFSPYRRNDGSFDASDAAATVRNFLIDLQEDRIVAALPSQHPGDKSDYNHTGLTAAWSADSKTAVVLASGKWDTRNAMLVRIAKGAAQTSDLGAAISAHLSGVLAKDRAFLQRKSEYTLTLSEPHFTTGAGLTISAALLIPKDETDSYRGFHLEGEIPGDDPPALRIAKCLQVPD